MTETSPIISYCTEDEQPPASSGLVMPNTELLVSDFQSCMTQSRHHVAANICHIDLEFHVMENTQLQESIFLLPY